MANCDPQQLRPSPPVFKDGKWTLPNPLGVDEATNPGAQLDEAAGIPEPQDGDLPGFDSRTSRRVLTEYARSLRGCDQAVRDEFQNLIVRDPEEKAFRVPIVMGPPEKAVAMALSQAVSKDSMRIDRIKLPIMALTTGDMSFAPERYTHYMAYRWLRDPPTQGMVYGTEKRYGDTAYGKSRGIPVDKNYTLYLWSRYVEDMNQMVEQIMLKFDHLITLQVPDVGWEVVLKINGISNSISNDIGDAAIRIVKYEFSLMAETYISRGLIRGKTVFDLHTDIGTMNGDSNEELVRSVTEEDLEALRRRGIHLEDTSS